MMNDVHMYTSVRMLRIGKDDELYNSANDNTDTLLLYDGWRLTNGIHIKLQITWLVYGMQEYTYVHSWAYK
jgi:hypothetical protein